MRKIAFVAGGLVAGLLYASVSEGQNFGPSPGDPQAFTDIFANLCRAAAPNLKLKVVGPLSLQADTAQGEVSVHLDTVYSACQRDPAGCGPFLNRMVDLTAKGFASARPATTLSQVRVTVRPSSYLDEMAAAGGKSDVIAEPLVGDLWVYAVRDEATSIATLDKADLDALKLDAAGAMAAGKHNVEATLGAKFQAGAPQVAPGEGVAGMRGDDYTASLLALPDLWAPLAEKFDGRLYVAAPASDYVLFADARAKGNAANIGHDAVVLARAAKRPLSTDVFEWTPTGWEVVDLGKAK
jgi:hypothetical protein